MKKSMVVGLLAAIVFVGIMALPVSAAVIRGTVVDVFTGAPLPSATYPYTFVGMTKAGQWFYVAYTVCFPQPGQIFNACADEDGQFEILGDTAGNPIPAGEYELWISAFNYKPEKMVVEFDGQTDVNLGVIALETYPVRLEFTKIPGPIPPQGGNVSWEIQLVSARPQYQFMNEYALLGVATAADTFWANFQRGIGSSPIPNIVVLPPEGGSSKKIGHNYNVRPEMPAGFSFCVTEYVTQLGAVDKPLYVNGFCVEKQETETQPPASPEQSFAAGYHAYQRMFGGRR